MKDSVREAFLRRRAALKRETEEKKGGEPASASTAADGGEGTVSAGESGEALDEERSYLDMERIEMRDVEDESVVINDRVVDVLPAPNPPNFAIFQSPLRSRRAQG